MNRTQHTTDLVDLCGREALGGREPVGSEQGDVEADPNVRVRQMLGSLRRRWWFYLLVTAIASFAAYKAALEFGSYDYTATSVVRRQGLPLPPGKTYWDPPSTAKFADFVGDPEVMETLIEQYQGGLIETRQRKLLDHKYDRSGGAYLVRSTRDTPAEAAEIVNQAVQLGIAKSQEVREEHIDAALTYYRALVGAAEAEAISKRQAKIAQLKDLRQRNPEERDAKLEFEELTESIRRKRATISRLKGDKVNAERLQAFHRSEEQSLIAEIRDYVVQQSRDQLKEAASRFSRESPQAKDLASKLSQVKSLGKRDIVGGEELDEWLREVGKVMDSEIGVPDAFTSRLRRAQSELYGLRTELMLLPQQIDDAERSLARMNEQWAGMEVSGESDFENRPEILELSAEIARAERNVEQITSAISWLEHMKTLGTPAYEPLVVASAATATPDGNQKKIALGVFGLVGLMLGMPLLMYDTLRSEDSPSQRLGNEFGLPMISAQEIHSGALANVSLQPNDPDLRLLALRIQQSARHSRGSAVLFSSLADSLSTEELTTTIASCLAAREERVLLIDLEPISEHRQGKLETIKPANVTTSVVNESEIASTVTHDDAVPTAADGETIAGTGANGMLSNGRRKVGLALALAGATKDVDDVLIERGSDGIDRLKLGRGELPVEAFASPMMTKLLDRFRNDYSMILLSGPAAKHVADVQMLAARCDGTLFVSPSRGEVSPLARRTILDLRENGAPIMGIAQVPA